MALFILLFLNDAIHYYRKIATGEEYAVWRTPSVNYITTLWLIIGPITLAAILSFRNKPPH